MSTVLRFSILLAFLIVALHACKNEKVKVDPIENINKGHISILCDADFRYVMSQHEEVYEHLFPGADIEFVYLSDAELMNKLMKNEAQCAVMGRRLSEQERANLQQKHNIIPKEHIIAKDAAALICGKNNNTFSGISYDSLMHIVTQNSDYRFVFPGRQTGLVKSFDVFNRMMSENKVFALDSLASVVEYINRNQKSVGVIPYALISDSDDDQSRDILKKVKLIRLSILDTAAKTIAVTASEQDIATGLYPMIRPVNYILLNPPQRVGMGFVNYLMRNRGAKVFLKSGLIPAVMPERDFIINTSGIEIKKD